jgi:hypothetical protein
MSPVRLGTNNDYAGEGQRQSARLTDDPIPALADSACGTPAAETPHEALS